MLEFSDPNQMVAGLGVFGLILAGLWGLAFWVRSAPVRPDPWSAEVQASMEAEDATPICHRCLTPHSNEAWFCEHCGSAVGACNNLMPYVNAFSEGEVFRNGTTDKLRRSPFIVFGYLLISLHAYLIFAPLYWFCLFKNLHRLRTQPAEPAAADGG